MVILLGKTSKSRGILWVVGSDGLANGFGDFWEKTSLKNITSTCQKSEPQAELVSLITLRAGVPFATETCP